MFAKSSFLTLTFCIFSLAACSEKTSEPVYERSSPEKAPSSSPSPTSPSPSSQSGNVSKPKEQIVERESVETKEATALATTVEGQANKPQAVAKAAPDALGEVITQPVLAKEVPSTEPVRSHDWNVNYSASTLSFTGTQTGNKFTGKFEAFDAKIRLNPDDLSTAMIEVSIDMKSAKTGDRQRDDAIPGEDWFAVKTFPKAMFRSTSIARIEGNNYSAAGTLTIRDISKDVSLPFTLNIDGDKAMATGGLSVQRNGFGVGQGQWTSDEWVKFDVGIDFTISAQRQ